MKTLEEMSYLHIINQLEEEVRQLHREKLINEKKLKARGELWI